MHVRGDTLLPSGTWAWKSAIPIYYQLEPQRRWLSH
ncbi:hypothetical protein RSAG8_13904, partial [Rhizoctonia solani AG-8 WAC10335]